MTRRNPESRCKRCLATNDNPNSHPSGRRVALCLACVTAREQDEKDRNDRRISGRMSHMWDDIACIQCETFFRPRTNNQKFCSQKCRNLYLKTWRQNRTIGIADPIPCDVCGVEFLRRSGNQKYCSDGCAEAVKDSKQAERSLRNRYLLTSQQFRDMYESQDGKCAICSTSFTSRSSIHVDHDHSCCPGGKSCGSCVRGLLCRNCNTMIGMANDSVDILKRAVTYLS